MSKIVAKNSISSKYDFKLKIGGVRLPVPYASLRKFHITHEMNTFLPTLDIAIQDSDGILSHLLVLDEKGSQMEVSLASGAQGEEPITYSFRAYRKFPTSDSIYDISGLLDVKNLFSPEKTRGFAGSVKDNLALIAEELGVTETDISPSLSSSRNFLQPSWTNAVLLNYLKTNLIGVDDEGGYFCFIQNIGKDQRFVFKPLKEFYAQAAKYTFTNSTEAHVDQQSGEIRFPILEHKVYDNGRVLSIDGTKRTDYSYFDYDDSRFRVDTLKVQGNAQGSDDFSSLSEYFSIDKEDPDVSVTMEKTGRSTDFTEDFKGRAKGAFYRRLNDLTKIRITSFGIQDIYPGDIVRLQFFDSLSDMFSFQFHGFWLVESVIHMMRYQFNTRLLLTRCGINTIEDTTLLPADRIKLK